jgi:hypothetical protein
MKSHGVFPRKMGWAHSKKLRPSGMVQWSKKRFLRGVQTSNLDLEPTRMLWNGMDGHSKHRIFIEFYTISINIPLKKIDDIP